MTTTIYRCKCHELPYTVCTVCTVCAHQYCPEYWANCPRCVETGRRISTATIFLISLTVFDDQTVMGWASSVDRARTWSPVQHIGLANDARWADVMRSMLETDDVRVCVMDRRTRPSHTFRVGDRVTTSGYAGTIVQVPTWAPTTNMVVVQLASGCVCVDAVDVLAVKGGR